MMRNGVFLQVRLDSSRLPRKALLPLEGKAVITHAMEALREIEADAYVLLTDREGESVFKQYAAACGFELFTGPKDDVLERYALAAERYQVTNIIRATGDNPLVSGRYAQLLLEMHLGENADYSGFRGLPLGTGVECIRTEALMRARDEAQAEYEREHVCPYLYRHPEAFSIFTPQVPEDCYAPELRVTLDTSDDYKRLEFIYGKLYRGKPIPVERLVRELPHSVSTAG